MSQCTRRGEVVEKFTLNASHEYEYFASSPAMAVLPRGVRKGTG
jgi:hypothetical protein